MDFKKEVIDRSREIPVLVDFWAPWCGPCRMLGPVLEELAAEQQDRWELVKVNTQDNPEIARAYQVMSIPNVKLFQDGEVVGEFVGALPRSHVEKWLDEAIPGAEQGELEEILAGQTAIPDPDTRSKLEIFVQNNPNHKVGKLILAQHSVFSDPEEALSLIEGIRIGEEGYELAEDIKNLVEFMTFTGAPGSSPQAEKLLKAAQIALANNDPGAAIERIIEATSIDKGLQRELPRRTAIALFRLWGNGHELTKRYRWKFDMALY